MTKKKLNEMIKTYKEFLKLSLMEFEESGIEGYRCISKAKMQEKGAEFLKYIGYEGDSTDFYYEYGINLLTIRLKAME